MKTPTLYLNSAFITLASEGILLDPVAHMAISTDGEAIALVPIPKEFDTARLVPLENAHEISTDSGEPCSDVYDLSQLVTPAAYRVALNPSKMRQLAAAIESNEIIIMEFPAHPSEGPIKFTGANGNVGYLMPQPIPEGMVEGLLVPSNIQHSKSNIPPQAELPPPVVTASAERHTLEIAFGGKPADEIREALKDPALGFRYSGRGTKRGVPPSMWYGPDNPFTREKIAALLQVEITEAKAA